MTVRMPRHIWLAVATLPLLGACEGPSPDQPPTVSYDVDACVECGMIISDERFATATIIPGDRGPRALLFDDFNCQAIHEAAHPDLDIIKRWAHDHDTRAWLDAATAHYVRAKAMYTPMMSHVAACTSKSGAEALATQHEGGLLTFDELWALLQTGDEVATPPK